MNSQTKSIITIGRSYGSGGREIGKKLAEELNIPFYDKELIHLAVKDSGMTEEYLKKADEKAMNSFLYGLYAGSSYPASLNNTNLNNMPINDRLFFMQTGFVRKFAQQGPCIIIGRCANDILHDKPNVISVFITAPLERRAARIHRLKPSLSQSSIVSQIKAVDRQRSNYFNTYTSQIWSDANNYHLSMDSSKLGIIRSVDFIKEYITLRDIQAE